MAKAKRSQRQEVQEPEDTELQIGGEEEADAEEDVISELQSLGAGGEFRYMVHRVSSKPGEPQGYCATFNAGELSLDAIREQFGGGKYRIRVVDASGKYKGMRTVELVPLPKQPAAAAPIQQQAPALDLQGIAALLSATRPTVQAGDSSAVLQVMGMIQSSTAEMMKAILAAQQKGPSVIELLTLMQQQKPADGESSAVSLLLKGLELGRGLDHGEAGLYDVAKEGLGAITTLIAQGQGNAQPVQAPALPPPAGAPVSDMVHRGAPAQTKQAGGDVSLIQKFNWLKQQTAALVLQASREKDPALYAEVMVDNLPPFITEEEIMQRMQAPDAVQQLAQVDSRVMQYAQWFEQFRLEVVELLTPEPEPQDGAAGTHAEDDPAHYD